MDAYKIKANKSITFHSRSILPVKIYHPKRLILLYFTKSIPNKNEYILILFYFSYFPINWQPK